MEKTELTLNQYEEAIGMRERLPAVDFPVRAYLQERAKRLRAIQNRWQECGEKECAAVYQGAAFELELLLQHSIAAAVYDLEEYNCPECDTPFRVAPTTEYFACKCGYGIRIDRDAEFRDGMWRNLTKVWTPPMVSERALTTDLARKASDKELITLLLLRQSSLCKITESHDDYATIREAKKSAEREVLYRLAEDLRATKRPIPTHATADWVCEQHPDREFPHDDCVGPGMLKRQVEMVSDQNIRGMLTRLEREHNELRADWEYEMGKPWEPQTTTD